MKLISHSIALTLLAAAPLLSSCASANKKATAAPVACASCKVKSKKGSTRSEKNPRSVSKSDEVDEYAVPEIADPIEPVNRAIFRFNDGLYTVLLRPIAKGYEFMLPKVLRKGIDNAFVNVEYPVRLVNCTLQGKFKRAGQESEKFVVNTVAGVGGLIRVSDKIDSLANVPAEDTGSTFANWGMGHGAYLVLPVLGPSSVRDGTGLAFDYALNPINWGIFWHGHHPWTDIPPEANTLRQLPGEMSRYDTTTKDAVDPYISVRNAWVQNRADAVKK